MAFWVFPNGKMGISKWLLGVSKLQPSAILNGVKTDMTIDTV